MRGILLSIAIIVAGVPAVAADPAIVMWNGYSVLISGATTETDINTAKIPESVVEIANMTCGSVGKEAHAQTAGKVAAFRAEYFYACL